MRRDREPDEDERREAIDQRRARRSAISCPCGLDGYPGRCPGAENCPFRGYHDEEEGEQNDE